MTRCAHFKKNRWRSCKAPFLSKMFFTGPDEAAKVETSPSGSSGPYAVIETPAGIIVAELFPASAPKTVANFVNLANAGFFNGLVWHRIVRGFVIQTGDPLTKNG